MSWIDIKTEIMNGLQPLIVKFGVEDSYSILLDKLWHTHKSVYLTNYEALYKSVTSPKVSEDIAYVKRYDVLRTHDTVKEWNEVVRNSVISVIQACPNAKFNQYSILPMSIEEIFQEIREYTGYDIEDVSAKNLLFLVSIRIAELRMTLHRLADTRLVIVDSETIGLDDVMPVQLTAIKTDFDLNVLSGVNYFITHAFIEQSYQKKQEGSALYWENQQDYDSLEAVKVHGLTSEVILGHNPVKLEEAWKGFWGLFSDQKTFLVAHNVRFEHSVLERMASALTQKMPPYKSSCTFQGRRHMNISNADNNKLTSWIKASGLTETQVIELMTSVFGEDTVEFAQAHNALYDTSALLLLIRQHRGFINLIT